MIKLFKLNKRKISLLAFITVGLLLVFTFFYIRPSTPLGFYQRSPASLVDRSCSQIMRHIFAGHDFNNNYRSFDNSLYRQKIERYKGDFEHWEASDFLSTMNPTRPTREESQAYITAAQLRLQELRKISSSIKQSRQFEKIKNSLQGQTNLKSSRYHLWDNWGHYDSSTQTYHRFSLAASNDLHPDQRHLKSHLRHFTSNDGKNWVDKGKVIDTYFDSRVDTIWSGSTYYDETSGQWHLYFTGTTRDDLTTQRIWKMTTRDHKNWSHPELFADGYTGRLKDQLSLMGYHLGDADNIISAFRDPYRLGDELYFATKAIDHQGHIRPAIGRLKNIDGNMEVAKPIFLDLDSGMTQIELPNIIQKNNKQYMIVTASNQGQIRGEAPGSFKSQLLIYERKGDDFFIRHADSVNGELITQKSGLYSGNIIRYTPEDDLKFLSFWHESVDTDPLSLPNPIPLELSLP